MTQTRVEMIRKHLEQALSPTSLEIIDDSHKHAGHASAGGAGHFTVHIIADAFAGLNLVQRHRLVYEAVSDLMQTDIHALSINAKAPTDN